MWVYDHTVGESVDVGRCRNAVCACLLCGFISVLVHGQVLRLHTHTHTQYQSGSLREPAACAQASLCFSETSHMHSYSFAGLYGDNWSVNHLNVTPLECVVVLWYSKEI